eukprot:1158706_1
MLYILYNMDCVYLFSAAMYFWFQCYFCICCLLQCSVARYQLQFISYTTLLTMATESIPTIQVGPQPHYKHKHGHHKHVKRPCKYYNQSGCRYKHEQCWYEHKPHIESVTHLILKSLQDLSRKFQENIQKTDLEMQNIHNKLNVIQQGQTHISQRLEAVEIGIQATHREISLNKQKLNTSHSSINTKLNKIKNEIRQCNVDVINSQNRIIFNVGSLSQELKGLKEGMNSIGSTVKKQINCINQSPINIRSTSNIRLKSAKHESEQQDIKQTEQVKELENKRSESQEERPKEGKHQTVSKGSTQNNVQQPSTEQQISRDASHQEDKDVDDEKDMTRRQKKVIGIRNKEQGAKETLTQIKYTNTSESKTSVNKHASQQHATKAIEEKVYGNHEHEASRIEYGDEEAWTEYENKMIRKVSKMKKAENKSFILTEDEMEEIQLNLEADYAYYDQDLQMHEKKLERDEKIHQLKTYGITENNLTWSLDMLEDLQMQSETHTLTEEELSSALNAIQEMQQSLKVYTKSN